jgi:ABC-type cobalamin/Fe3+-siderophores transport system ATPase subunit
MAFSIQELTVRLPMLGERTIGTVRKHDAPRPSNVTILIGRNGSGKSTILRDVIQILRPLGQLGRARAAAFSVRWRNGAKRTSCQRREMRFPRS